MNKKEKEIINILFKFQQFKISLSETKIKILKLFTEEPAYCNPPNITYCKHVIYPSFDCTTCKWVFKNK